MIHGRWDVSGPLDTAWELHRAWPGSQLVVLDDAGHGGNSMSAAIVAALRQGAPEKMVGGDVYRSCRDRSAEQT